jgi:uncharacterized protein YuzE
MTFDSSVGAAYIYNRGRAPAENAPHEIGVVKRSIEANKKGTLIIDLDKDGQVFGVEILNPEKVKLSTILGLLGEKPYKEKPVADKSPKKDKKKLKKSKNDRKREEREAREAQERLRRGFGG